MTRFTSGRNVLAVVVLVLAHCAASAFARGKAEVATEFIADGAPVGGAKLSANCQAGVEAKGLAGRWVKTPLKAGAGDSR